MKTNIINCSNLIIFLVFLANLFTVSCGRKASFENLEQISACDPSGLLPSDPTSGLVGTLYNLDDNQVDSLGGHLDDYFQNGYENPSSVFLSHVNLPTQMFTTGFVSPGIGPLRKQDGTVLFEWFALKLKTFIKLAEQDPEGSYQFAILSDDGSRMIIKNQDQALIDNDGITGSRFLLQYFQGPRMHIAFILMWRLWEEGVDPAQGQAGNGLYFDPTVTPAAPQQAYLDLLERGWKPLSPENFALPEGITNPCYE